MKPTIVFYLLALFLLNSCMVLFEKPQPVHTRELKEVPTELIGTYVEEDNDTLIITRNSFDYKEHGPFGGGPMDKGTLEPGKVVLKKLDDAYVLNYKVEDFEGEGDEKPWMVYLIKLNDHQLSVNYVATEEKDSDQTIGFIKSIAQVKEQVNSENEKYYIVSPSKKEFKKMVDQHIFKESLQFRKVK